MRTTLNLDQDVLLAAKGVARERRVSVGRVVSELARGGLAGRAFSPMRNGVPLFPVGPEARMVTTEFVNQLRDETR